MHDTLIAQRRPGADPAPTDEPMLNDRFWEWFGDSQVLGDDGQPLVVYHGTPGALFDVFDKARQGTTTFIGIPVKVQRHGFYFAEDAAFAQSFAEQADCRTGNVVAVYLNIRKPLRMLSSGIWWRDIDALVAQGVSRTWLEEHAGDPRNTWEALDDEDGAFLVGAIKAAGYDGILMEETCPNTDENKLVWVAFEPNQVKSALNPGTWDPASPRLCDAASLAEQVRLHAARARQRAAEATEPSFGPGMR